MQIRLWAVVGPNNSGKSSTIGALVSQTGKGRGGIRSVLLRGGGWLYLHAYRQSIQEAGMSIPDSIDRFEKIANIASVSHGASYLNLLLALRSDSIGGLPTADGYLKEFVRNGWELSALALLDCPTEYDRYARFGAPMCDVRDASTMTAVALERNWVFGQVRNHFGWA